jgi:hypothetical protein
MEANSSNAKLLGQLQQSEREENQHTFSITWEFPHVQNTPCENNLNSSVNNPTKSTITALDQYFERLYELFLLQCLHVLEYICNH